METSRKKIKIRPSFKNIQSNKSFQKSSLSIIDEKLEKTHLTKKSEGIIEEELTNHHKKVTPNFFQHIMRINLINLFLKNLKKLSGKFGPLGKKQLKIINDISTDYTSLKEQDEDSTIDSHNILVQVIVKNSLLFFLYIFFNLLRKEKF